MVMVMVSDYINQTIMLKLLPECLTNPSLADITDPPGAAQDGTSAPSSSAGRQLQQLPQPPPGEQGAAAGSPVGAAGAPASTQPGD